VVSFLSRCGAILDKIFLSIFGVRASPQPFFHLDADDGASKARKPWASKERPPGWTNAVWAADVER
jgi:hypothetical protein